MSIYLGVLVVAGTLAEAEAAFRQGVADREDAARARPSFRVAERLYAAAWDEGHRTPGVACNMARAALLCDDVPAGVLACRRGLARWPEHQELLAILTVARNRAAPPPESDVPKRGPPVTRTWYREIGIIVGVIGVALSGMYLLGAMVRPRQDRFLLAMSLLGSLGVLLGSLRAGDGQADVWTGPAAVVSHPGGAVLRTGDGPDFPRRFEQPLPPGTEVTVLIAEGDAWQVELVDGSVGWLPASAVTAVGPLGGRPGSP